MSDDTYDERRRNDRRQSDRRQAATEESWFGALGGDTEMHADDVHEAARPPADRELPRRAPDAQAQVQRQQTREARRIASSPDTALRRVFRTYIAARAVLGLLLAWVPWVVTAPNVHSVLPLALLCLGYAAQSVTLWMLPQLRVSADPAMARLGRRQWLAINAIRYESGMGRQIGSTAFHLGW